MPKTIEVPILPDCMDQDASEELYNRLVDCLLDFTKDRLMVFNDMMLTVCIFHSSVVEMTEKAMIEQGIDSEDDIPLLRVAVLQTLSLMMENQTENDDV